MRKLLLVDDDQMMVTLLVSLLSQNGFEVVVANTVAEARRRLDGSIAAILLDVGLPDEDGFTYLRHLRDTGEQRPIILVTAREDDQDCIRGLNLGADDFVVKPFNYLVLIARIEAILRRAARPQAAQPTGDSLDANQRVLRLGGRSIPLTVTEFRLLEVMSTRAGRTFSRGELWQLIDDEGTSDSFDRAIDLHIARLRAKLEADPKEPRHLLTVRGVGYRYEW
ncbi:MAG: response regulator transcription factor [Cyanobacteria bacterium RYN_339]|nr:response regulator transcription factor [Cyanobacteria bacterium RYN_339]